MVTELRFASFPHAHRQLRDAPYEVGKQVLGLADHLHLAESFENLLQMILSCSSASRLPKQRWIAEAEGEMLADIGAVDPKTLGA